MIIELSRDKSLLNILSKVDLDKETKALLKVNASASEIKKSLQKNINNTNIVQYRKYILKAEEEEELGGKTIGFEEEDYASSGKDDVDESVDSTQRIESGEQENLKGELQQVKKAYKYLNALRVKVDALEDIANSAQAIKRDNKVVIRGAMRDYLRVGTSPVKSSKMLDDLSLIKKDPNYLKTKYGSLLDNGILMGKDIKEKDGQSEIVDNKSKDINVNSLTDRINTLLKLEFNVSGSEDTIDFSTVLRRLHVQKHKREPTHLLDRPKLSREFKNILLVTQGKNPTVEREYDKAIKELNDLNKKLTRILGSKTIVEDTITDLEQMLGDSDKLVANKLKKLNAALRTFVSRERLDNEKLSGKLQELKDFSKNREKYVREATAEIEEELEIEKKKLEQLIFDLDAAERVKPITKEFKRIVSIFRDSDPIAAVKELIVEGISIVTYLSIKAKVLQRVAGSAEEDIEEGLQAYLEDNPEISLRLDSDGLSFDGLPTVDAKAMSKIDEISDQFAVKQGELEEIVNRLNNLIEGQKTPPVPKEAKPTEESRRVTSENSEFNIRDYVYEKPKGEE